MVNSTPGWRVQALCGIVLFSAVLTPSLAAAQQPRGVFLEVAGGNVTDRHADRTVVRARRVSVDLGQLRSRTVRSADVATLVLNLFSDTSFEAVLDRLDATPGGYVWIGHIPGIAMSTVTLAREGDVLYGTILTRGNAYEVRPTSAGDHVIAQIDQSSFPPEADLAPAMVSPGTGKTAGVIAAADDGSTVDVMVLYTPAAALGAGGSSGIAALISNAISITNLSYANSGVTQRLRVVYSAQVNYSETGGSAGIFTDLQNITNGAGALSGVAGLRNTYGADVVTLLTNTPGTSYCGIAWLMENVSTFFAPFAFSVVEQSCAAGNMSLAHELGHNMGARHDWYVDNGNVTLPFSYSHGYVDPVGRWRTIMSYNDLCGTQGFLCSRLAYWSNPGLTLNGASMGVPGGTNSSASCIGTLSYSACDADDHRTLNDTALTVANFRASAVSATSLTPSVPTPVSIGTPVTWTATAQGGTAPYTYKFFVYDGSGWTVGQDWSPANTWTWTPSNPGSYTFQVWVRNAGSSAPYDAWTSAPPYTVIGPPPLSVTSLNADHASPTLIGTPVTWTATSTGGTCPCTYKFFLYDGTTWSVGQDWSASNTWMWTPSSSGNYTVQVWARNAGSSAAYDAWRGAGPYTVIAPPLVITSLAADRSFPVPLGTSVTWTATANGGLGPYTFKFLVYNGTTWSIGRDWNASNTWTWAPSNTGTYNIQVWVRNAGSAANYDAWTSAGPITVSAPGPLTATGLSSDVAFPLPAGTPVTWTASAAGGTQPYTYKFWVFDGSNWILGRDWAPASSWQWVTSPPGTYNVQVWVRSAGSVATYDDWRGSGPVTVTAPAPLSVTNLWASSSLATFTPVTISASAIGGTGPYTFKFLLYDGTTWSVARDWDPSNTWIWVPLAGGTYTVQVWVRNAGSLSFFDAWSPLTLIVP